MKKITKKQAQTMDYVDLMASIREENRPPGGKEAVRTVAQNCFLTNHSRVLDVGCNTGYVTFELSRLIKCQIMGIDINAEMIKAANSFKKNDFAIKGINFKVANGMKLPFKNGSFDLVISGGSTAFIEDKKRALLEYARVVKYWGFIADINFFYKKTPPKQLITRLNRAMKINIRPWKAAYWLNLYRDTGLELYYHRESDVYVPSSKEIKEYCRLMAVQANAMPDAKKIIEKRLNQLMGLFADNHKYLAYAVFIMRKRPAAEQISLFGV